MSKQPKQINLADTVMQRIADEGIAVRPQGYFQRRKTAWATATTTAVVLSGLLIVGLSYVLRYDTFTEYLTLPNGTWLFIQSLPWPGITLAVVSIVLGLLAAKRARSFVPGLRVRQVALSLGIFALIVGMLGSVGQATQTPQVFSYLSYLSAQDPIKLEGTITDIDGNTLTLENADGVRTYQVINLPQDIEAGDTVLLLGTKQGDTLNVNAAKVISEASEQQTENKTVKEQKSSKKQATVETKEPVTEEPAPTVTTPKTETTTPKTETKQDPQPTKTITITNIQQYDANKYKVSWSANFTLKQGYKMVWSLSPSPTYPANPDPGVPYYYFDGTSRSSGTGFVKKSMGVGKYYVRVCEYLGGSCGVYSAQFTVTFN
jgi:hypothetical protein